MTTVIDTLSWALLAGGCAFCIVGGIGLVRFPDFYSRIHATGLTDTLGATLIILGLVLQAGPTLIGAKLLFILFFLLITSPTANHALVKAAYAHGIKVPGAASETDPPATDSSDPAAGRGRER